LVDAVPKKQNSDKAITNEPKNRKKSSMIDFLREKRQCASQ
jgi:hypothetical protein